MIVNATKRLNLLVWKISLGVVLSAYPRNGFAMAIRTVWMEPMRTLPCTIVPINNHVLRTCSLAEMDAALIKYKSPYKYMITANSVLFAFHRAGCAIMTMTAVMEQTRENSAMLSTRHARPWNLPARTSSVSAISIAVMERTTAEITRTRWTARRITQPAQ